MSYFARLTCLLPTELLPIQWVNIEFIFFSVPHPLVISERLRGARSNVYGELCERGKSQKNAYQSTFYSYTPTNLLNSTNKVNKVKNKIWLNIKVQTHEHDSSALIILVQKLLEVEDFERIFESLQSRLIDFSWSQLIELGWQVYLI